jgi:hypothetical protein
VSAAATAWLATPFPALAPVVKAVLIGLAFASVVAGFFPRDNP